MQTRLLVCVGDRVTAGQVLAEFDSSELAAQILSQEAQVARAVLLWRICASSNSRLRFTSPSGSNRLGCCCTRRRMA